MEQGHSWVAYSSRTNQNSTRILLKSKVNYWVLKSPPLDPVVSQMNPVYSPSYVIKIHCNIIDQCNFINIIRMIKPGMMRWEGQVAHMGKGDVGKPEGKRLRRRHRHR
jgi:hypothetical protein